jgi:hypothetical protein
MNEDTIGKMYIAAFSFAQNSNEYTMIMRYKNPDVVPPQEGVGVLSLIIHHIMKTMQQQSDEQNRLSIGELNEYLDELVSLPREAWDMKSDHDRRMKNNNNNTIASNKRDDENNANNATTKKTITLVVVVSIESLIRSNCYERLGCAR